jgi:DNA-binding NarL/FixJ family response regulator
VSLEAQAAERATTCVVADDHVAIAELLSVFLAEHGIDVVATARDGLGALATIIEVEPAAAVVDVVMPRMGGIDVVRELTRLGTPTRVILYTGFDERALLVEALDAGAAGYVLKDSPLDEVVRAIRTVAAGERYIDAAVAPFVVASLPAETALSARQREVLRLLADGLTTEEIGVRLRISPDTARTHLQAAIRKLAANNRTEAVAIALRRSLIS